MDKPEFIRKSIKLQGDISSEDAAHFFHTLDLDQNNYISIAEI